MNEAELIKLEKKLRKAKRSSIFCGVLMVMAAFLIVIFSKIGGQAVDQEAITTAVMGFVILMAAIAGLCEFFHSSVKAKIKQLQL